MRNRDLFYVIESPFAGIMIHTARTLRRETIEDFCRLFNRKIPHKRVEDFKKLHAVGYRVRRCELVIK